MVLNAVKISVEQFCQSSLLKLAYPLVSASLVCPSKKKKVACKTFFQDQKKYEMEEGINKAAWEKTMANNRQK